MSSHVAITSPHLGAHPGREPFAPADGPVRGPDRVVSPEARPEWKREADLIAAGALAGFEIVRMADGSFVAGKWGMVAALADLDAVQAFLRRVGAAR